MHQPSDVPQHLGFLTIVELPELAAIGGLLLVNRRGRPVEFHCTTPVVANRTQQVLYGATLKSFLHVEQIGLALLSRVKQAPALVVVDRPLLVQLAPSIEAPLLYLAGAEEGDAGPPAVAAENEIEEFATAVPGARLHCRASQFDAASALAVGFHDCLPLTEPFERIRQALEEAHALPQAS